MLSSKINEKKILFRTKIEKYSEYFGNYQTEIQNASENGSNLQLFDEIFKIIDFVKKIENKKYFENYEESISLLYSHIINKNPDGYRAIFKDLFLKNDILDKLDIFDSMNDFIPSEHTGTIRDAIFEKSSNFYELFKKIEKEYEDFIKLTNAGEYDEYNDDRHTSDFKENKEIEGENGPLANFMMGYKKPTQKEKDKNRIVYDLTSFTLSSFGDPEDIPEKFYLENKQNQYKEKLGTIRNQEKSNFSIIGKNDEVNDYFFMLTETGKKYAYGDFFEEYLSSQENSGNLFFIKQAIKATMNGYYVPQQADLFHLREENNIDESEENDDSYRSSLIITTKDDFDGINILSEIQEIPDIFTEIDPVLAKSTVIQNLKKIFNNFCVVETSNGRRMVNPKDTKETLSNEGKIEQTMKNAVDCFIFVMISISIWKNMLINEKRNSIDDHIFKERVAEFLNTSWTRYSKDITTDNFEKKAKNFMYFFGASTTDLEQKIDFFARKNFFPERRDASLINLGYNASLRNGYDSWSISLLIDKFKAYCKKNNFNFKELDNIHEFIYSKLRGWDKSSYYKSLEKICKMDALNYNVVKLIVAEVIENIKTTPTVLEMQIMKKRAEEYGFGVENFLSLHEKTMEEMRNERAKNLITPSRFFEIDFETNFEKQISDESDKVLGISKLMEKRKKRLRKLQAIKAKILKKFREFARNDLTNAKRFIMIESSSDSSSSDSSSDSSSSDSSGSGNDDFKNYSYRELELELISVNKQIEEYSEDKSCLLKTFFSTLILKFENCDLGGIVGVPKLTFIAKDNITKKDHTYTIINLDFFIPHKKIINLIKKSFDFRGDDINFEQVYNCYNLTLRGFREWYNSKDEKIGIIVNKILFSELKPKQFNNIQKLLPHLLLKIEKLLDSATLGNIEKFDIRTSLIDNFFSLIYESLEDKSPKFIKAVLLLHILMKKNPANYAEIFENIFYKEINGENHDEKYFTKGNNEEQKTDASTQKTDNMKQNKENKFPKNKSKNIINSTEENSAGDVKSSQETKVFQDFREIKAEIQELREEILRAEKTPMNMDDEDIRENLENLRKKIEEQEILGDEKLKMDFSSSANLRKIDWEILKLNNVLLFKSDDKTKKKLLEEIQNLEKEKEKYGKVSYKDVYTDNEDELSDSDPNEEYFKESSRKKHIKIVGKRLCLKGLFYSQGLDVSIEDIVGVDTADRENQKSIYNHKKKLKELKSDLRELEEKNTKKISIFMQSDEESSEEEKILKKISFHRQEILRLKRSNPATNFYYQNQKIDFKKDSYKKFTHEEKFEIGNNAKLMKLIENFYNGLENLETFISEKLLIIRNEISKTVENFTFNITKRGSLPEEIEYTNILRFPKPLQKIEIMKNNMLPRKKYTGFFGLNIIDKKNIKKENFTQNEHELFGAKTTGLGLYPHQINICELFLRSLKENKNYFLNMKANLGSGKTAAVNALAKIILLYNNEKVKTINQKTGEEKLRNKNQEEKALMIFCTESRKALNEFMTDFIELDFNPYGAFKFVSKRGKKVEKIVFMRKHQGEKTNSRKSPGIIQDREDNDEFFKSLVDDGNILICHPQIALEFITMKEAYERSKFAYGRRVFLVLDEIKTEKINTPLEHAIGSLFSYPGISTFIVLSASLDDNSSYVKFLTAQQEKERYNPGKVEFLESFDLNLDEDDRNFFASEKGRIPSVVSSKVSLVPCQLRDITNDPIDPYLGYKNPEIINLVNTDETFRRFISYINIEEISKFSLEDTKETAALRKRCLELYQKAKENNVYDPAVFYTSLPPSFHKNLRKFIDHENKKYNLKSESINNFVIDYYNKKRERSFAIKKIHERLVSDLQQIVSILSDEETEKQNELLVKELISKFYPDLARSKKINYNLLQEKLMTDFSECYYHYLYKNNPEENFDNILDVLRKIIEILNKNEAIKKIDISKTLQEINDLYIKFSSLMNYLKYEFIKIAEVLEKNREEIQKTPEEIEIDPREISPAELFLNLLEETRKISDYNTKKFNYDSYIENENLTDYEIQGVGVAQTEKEKAKKPKKNLNLKPFNIFSKDLPYSKFLMEVMMNRKDSQKFLNGVSSEIEKSAEQLIDENNLISSNNYYTLVATNEPNEKMIQIYGELIQNIIFATEIFSRSTEYTTMLSNDFGIQRETQNEGEKITVTVRNPNDDGAENEENGFVGLEAGVTKRKQVVDSESKLDKNSEAYLIMQNLKMSDINDNASIDQIKKKSRKIKNAQAEIFLDKLTEEKNNLLKILLYPESKALKEFSTFKINGQRRYDQLMNILQNGKISDYYNYVLNYQNAKPNERGFETSILLDQKMRETTSLKVLSTYISNYEKNRSEKEEKEFDILKNKYYATITNMVKSYGFNLPYGIFMNGRTEEKGRMKGFPEFISMVNGTGYTPLDNFNNFVLEMLKIFVTDTNTKLPKNKTKYNICFGNSDLATQITRPFESVIITESFQQNKIDQIVQISGRCGRPGPYGSTTSVVFMSRKCYKKIAENKESENSVKNITLRNKFYLQPGGSLITDNIKQADPKELRISKLFEKIYSKYKDRFSAFDSLQ